MRRQATIYGLVLISLAVICTGCSRDILDPTQIGRFRPTPVTNVILDSLWVGDEPDRTFAGAQEPRPEDLIPYDIDYRFGTGDIVRISIYELRQEGLPFVNDYQVTETGMISIPDVGLVRAQGLTEKQLEDEIKQALYPDILLDPSVTVLLVNSERLVYSVNGQGVGRPGQYQIPRSDFRLSRALAQAGSVAQFNVSTIYVTRRVSGERAAFEQTIQEQERDDEDIEPGEMDVTEPGDGQDTTEDEILEMISPSMMFSGKTTAIRAADTDAEELEALAAPEGMEDKQQKVDRADNGRIEWIFENGRWVPKQVGEDTGADQEIIEQAGPDQSTSQEQPEGTSYSWDQIGTGGTQTRVIEIPREKLFGGDPRYDIIIRPGDAITVPIDLVGEFFVTGNLNFDGAIPLTGRPITLKQAIALGGGLGPLAWPKKVEVIRRIGKNRELIVMVDLEKIAKGLQPDFFIKEYDLINVGTHGSSRYLATLRNAFRFTYGFGFIYDRNFADRDFGQFDNFDPGRILGETF
ncbi:Vi polysaccharide export protein VexA [Anaerohalosphaera lusitana]|uniref:Vi polysaccharide export protein VexA n=1 Tax=Anaerohalosphaera lusitana TaxID=1936003 RepID=A0A1U9NPH8_9BACT|nr:polysaccharide biosynthesis/export family protein [Anaerohalosphaera lusitana]AQT69697.1 Vi polysaccharide export protein VexA [Anaerohalosphaera lusitana]